MRIAKFYSSLMAMLLALIPLSGRADGNGVVSDQPSGSMAGAGSVLSTSEGGASQQRQVAPDFELPNLEGLLVRLSDYRGKTVVLDFWAPWCPPCRAALPQIQQLADEYPEVVFLPVTLRTTPEETREMLTVLRVSLPVVLDPNWEVGGLYQVNAIPTLVLIGADGTILQSWLGANEPELRAALQAMQALHYSP